MFVNKEHTMALLHSTHYVHRSIGDSVGNFAARLVFIASFVVTSLLGLRFLLSLMGANPNNPIANFIYNTSSPLVTPFVGLFNYHPHYDITRFDFESLVALVAYGVIALILTSLLSGTSEDVVD